MTSAAGTTNCTNPTKSYTNLVGSWGFVQFVVRRDGGQ